MAEIEHLAACPSLTIYAGVGATIDKIDIGWKKLITLLVTDARNPEDEILKRHAPFIEDFVERHYPPNLAASAVDELYHEEFGHDYRQMLRRRIEGLIYNKNKWAGGLLAYTIAQLVIARQIAHRSTCIVTTNYDDYLEVELRRAREEALSGPFRTKRLPEVTRKFSVSRTGKLPARNRLDVLYLHGFIPRKPEFLPPEAEPILSELDYFETEDRVQHALERAFEDSSVLIVGSSLVDAPLLKALYATRSSTDRGHRRIALVPLDASDAKDRRALATASVAGERPEPDGSVAAMFNRELFQKRLRQFSVKPLFPDFFAQVSQFVNEVGVAIDRPQYSRDDQNYDHRLATWWRQWSNDEAEPLGTIGGLRRQRRHHERLHKFSKDIADRLALGDDIQVEAWLRWAPSTSNRQLRLWASSAELFRVDSVARQDQIENDSDYVSIEAFCTGRPILRDRSMGLNGRWSAYLSTPIWLSDRSNLPVGAMTLALLNGELPRSSADRTSVLTLLRTLGVEIASP